MDGVLIVDKPSGPTSHDVVAWARRALGQREVGHAGTLDPMATGVLVLGVGEGTKLTAFWMADDKEYEATLALGAETDTLDAQGAVVEEAAVPELDRETVERAMRTLVGTYKQRAPTISAIKQGGVALHARARRGEAVEAPEREVVCHRLELLALDRSSIRLRVVCGKGFYVRSLGRDLARALGTRGHLSALRRLRSGPFGVEDAISGNVFRAAREDQAARSAIVRALLPIERAVAGIGILEVDARAADDLRHGRPVACARPDREPIAVVGPDGRLVAIVRWERGMLRVVRGFRHFVASDERRAGA
jgi:tRNA pseudouridine55 synthase